MKRLMPWPGLPMPRACRCDCHQHQPGSFGAGPAPLAANRPHLAEEAGGLSGAPLRARALEVLRRLRVSAGPQLPLIGVGGIDSPQAAWERIAAGASLVQLYTGWIYRGPELVPCILDGLLQQLEHHGCPASLQRWVLVCPGRSAEGDLVSAQLPVMWRVLGSDRAAGPLREQLLRPLRTGRVAVGIEADAVTLLAYQTVGGQLQLQSWQQAPLPSGVVDAGVPVLTEALGDLIGICCSKAVSRLQVLARCCRQKRWCCAR